MQQNSKKNETVNILDLFFYLLGKWKWFLLFVVLGVGAAYILYSSTAFTYFCSATIAIKDPANKAVSAGLNRYDNLINKVNVTNEIYRFRSHKLMKKVVERTGADVCYKQPNRLRFLELYSQTPVKVTFPDEFKEGWVSFNMTLQDSVNVIISDIEDEVKPVTARLGDSLVFRGVTMVLTPTHYLNQDWIGKPILVEKRSVSSMASLFVANLGIRQEAEEASILKLSFQDSSPLRAKAVLNALIQVYNEEVIIEKNQIAVNTADFINERLLIIEAELGVVEADLESFKKRNALLDLSSEASISVSAKQQYSGEILELQTQLGVAKSMRKYLDDPSKEVELIPVNTGLDDPNIESLISQYNVLKLRRDKLVEEGSGQNPIVLDVNNSLSSLKQSVVRSVDNVIVTLESRLNEAVSQEKFATARMFAVPQKERELLSIERQQEIKEALYVFLLNKREENALTQAMVDNNAHIINDVAGSTRPIAPVRAKYLLLGLLLGLAVPGVWFLAKLFLDTRVKNRRDIKDNVTVPFLGEIPLDNDHLKKKIKGAIVVDGGNHSQSEAFRILRTNMSFMSKKGHAGQVITFVSFNEGAGKTFVSTNLAASFAMAKKKVVAVDLDIRKGTMTSILGCSHTVGMTNYLYDPDIKLDDIIIKGVAHENLDFIPAGSKAPNPAELLMDERLDELMNDLRSRYDYIIVDNVPVSHWAKRNTGRSSALTYSLPASANSGAEG